jgi:hypothetical protein
MRSGSTIPFRPRQPEPLSTHVAHIMGLTVISRLYPVEQVENCTNCPPGRCSSGDHGACLVVVPWHVPDEQAASFRFPAAAADRGLGGATG